MDVEAAPPARDRAWVVMLLGAVLSGAACDGDSLAGAVGAADGQGGASVDAAAGEARGPAADAAAPGDGPDEPPGAGSPHPWPPPEGRWEKLAPIPELPRFYVGMAAARGRLFVIGGVSPGAFDTGPERIAVHAYDPRTDKWERMPSLPTPMIMPNAVAVGDELFVLGAIDASASYAFDFARRAWIPRAPLPVPRGPGGAAIGVSGTTVLLAGGAVRGLSGNMLNTGKRQSGLLGYAVASNTWVSLPELPVAVGYAAGAVIGDQFLVMGGSTDFARTDQVLVYDIAKQTWDTGVNLPLSLSSATAAVIGGRVLLTGGIATETGMLSPNTLIFDPLRKAWATVAPLPTRRFSHGSALLDGRLYVATGLGMVPTAAMYGVVPDLEVFIP